uniref:AAA+ ATPase domain-containing protein n=1 Tax=Chromera velia CCMP2878 TaxID=1169474 RepID=A0A0G4H9J9_9ALVE|eukprot:Cvel_5950.t1-p1 / transcript=Cvel_5950.t1 / gene=Cvel_5950 / organism=Chromera_velia_CCMP2878 / gene_product=Putative cell division cycle ATPase, putative / transcript_product=Putative cell division cycle ATPase, putative / location=Cvel_scaffold284:74751-85227(-) / protein_length=848 / sequence_SO=supercontig / SO=protein_coding / is_pseudo=false
MDSLCVSLCRAFLLFVCLFTTAAESFVLSGPTERLSQRMRLPSGAGAGGGRQKTTALQGNGKKPFEELRGELETFEKLRKLDERVERLSERGTVFLSSFWCETLSSFMIAPLKSATKPSVTSTCLSVQAILENPSMWGTSVQWEDTGGEKISLRKATDTMRKVAKDADWSSAVYRFRTPYLVSTLSRMVPEGELMKDSKFQEAIDTLIEQRPHLSFHRKQTLSTYQRHKNAMALLAALESGLVVQTDPRHAELLFGVERVFTVSFDELCRQIAFWHAGDNQNFDVVMLAYSLASYVQIASHPIVKEQGRSLPPMNLKLVSRALDLLFSVQKEDGTWEKGEPIDRYVAGSQGAPPTAPPKIPHDSSAASISNPVPVPVRPPPVEVRRVVPSSPADPTAPAEEDDPTAGVRMRSSKEIGNSYVFFVDLLGEIVKALGEKEPELLAPYLENIERCVEWLEDNVLQEKSPSTKMGLVQGWRSNHLLDGGPVAWCTAQAVSSLFSVRRLLKSLLTSCILDEFGGAHAASEGANSGAWTQLLDAELSLQGSQTSLKGVLQPRLLTPMMRKMLSASASLLPREKLKDYDPICAALQSPELAASQFASSNHPPVYSLILFGPPGTAKTTICTSIAKYLGWHFVTIDTAQFLADGLGNVANRMRYIFDRLKCLEKTIILFDEIEEFCQDRENERLGMESRMLTTAMLTQLNDLRRKQKAIFIVATNRLRTFDAAVTRPGRFDMILFVGTPNLSARVSRLKGLLSNTGMSEEKKSEACALVSGFMEANWKETAEGKGGLRFLNFAESDVLLKGAVSEAVDGRLTEASLQTSFEALRETATIQGAVKEEYVSSERMSRV